MNGLFQCRPVLFWLSFIVNPLRLNMILIVSVHFLLSCLIPFVSKIRTIDQIAEAFRQCSRSGHHCQHHYQSYYSSCAIYSAIIDFLEFYHPDNFVVQYVPIYIPWWFRHDLHHPIRYGLSSLIIPINTCCLWSTDMKLKQIDLGALEDIGI